MIGSGTPGAPLMGSTTACATLRVKLLADFPLRGLDSEPDLPFGTRATLDRAAASSMTCASSWTRSASVRRPDGRVYRWSTGRQPWGYLWARRFRARMRHAPADGVARSTHPLPIKGDLGQTIA